MSNDTNRLLRYMYGELDAAETERIEDALLRRPELFDRWFAFHEIKQRLDAQPPARPDASVVDQIVDQARTAAQSTTPASSDQPERAPICGDGVPQDESVWYSVTVPPGDRHEDAPQARASSTQRASSQQAAASAETNRTSSAARRSARAWGLALVLAVMLVLSGAPEPGGSAESFAHEASASAELPEWDAPIQRAAIYQQAAALSARTPAPALHSSSAVSSTTW
jgi:hypothetical protein